MLNEKKLLTKILVQIKAPYLFKLTSRSITQNAGKNYWNMPDNMDGVTGYTRIPIAYRTSNGSVCPIGCVLNNDGSVSVQAYNYSSSSQTATLYCLYLWVRDDLVN